MLHAVEESEFPKHGSPPLYGPIIVLVRVLVPLPHVLEHPPHDPQLLQVQSTEIKEHATLPESLGKPL